MAQLGNNVIIGGMQEQHWESYSTTKDRVYDTIASAMGGSDPTAALAEARKIEITYCSRTGSYQLNCPCPISVIFHNREDKQNLMQAKKNLPKGVYVNEEYPVNMKRNCDILRPILRLAKTLLEFREKSKLQGDKLIINGTHYSVKQYCIATTRTSSLQSGTKIRLNIFSVPQRAITLLQFP